MSPPHSESDTSHPSKLRRMANLDRLPERLRDDIVAAVGEFAGTELFLMFAFGGTQTAYLNSPPDPNAGGAPANTSTLSYIALSFGFSLAVTAWVFFRISGGLFNPAKMIVGFAEVTLALVLIGTMAPFRGILLISVQIVGGIGAAGTTSTLFPGHFTMRCSLGGGTSPTRGLFIEMFLTIFLILTVPFVAAEKQRSTAIAPVAFGLAIFVAMLTGSYFTGAGLNLARAFGRVSSWRTFRGTTGFIGLDRGWAQCFRLGSTGL